MDELRWSGRPAGRGEILSRLWNPLRATTRIRPHGIIVLSIQGELDISTEKPLRDLVNTAVLCGGPEVTLDLSAITFCDTSGLWTLRRCGEDVHALDGTLMLAGLSDRMLWLMEVSGLWRAFAPVVSTLDALDSAPTRPRLLYRPFPGTVRPTSPPRTSPSSWETLRLPPEVDQSSN